MRTIVAGFLSVLLIVVVGSAIVGLVLRGSTGDAAACPRTFPPTDMTAMLLLEDTSGLTGLSREVELVQVHPGAAVRRHGTEGNTGFRH